MASVAEFADKLELRNVSEGHFVSPGRPDGDAFQFAGMLSALMVKAVTEVHSGAVVRSVDVAVPRVVTGVEDAEVVVRTLHAGRQLGVATVTIEQGGRACATATVVLGPDAEALVEHAPSAPAVASPADCPAGYEELAGESRVVDGISLRTSAQALPPTFSVWRRVAGAEDGGVRPEVVLAHDAASFITGTTLLPHDGVGLEGAHHTFMAAITNSHVVFHRPIDLDDWVLMQNEGDLAAGGWVHGSGRIFTAGGELAASYLLDAMVRAMPDRAGSAL